MIGGLSGLDIASSEGNWTIGGLCGLDIASSAENCTIGRLDDWVYGIGHRGQLNGSEDWQIRFRTQHFIFV